MPAGAKRMPLRRLLCRRCAEALRRGRCGSGGGRSKGECEVGMAWTRVGTDSNIKCVETSGGEDV